MMQIMLKFRGIRKDGGADVTMEVGVEAATPQAKAQAKSQILSVWKQLGGIVKDDPDGVTRVYPHALFKMIEISESSIILTNKVPS
jgi:hypothetical protein